MLRNSFSHIRGVGEKTEIELWRAGCLTWDDYLRTPEKFASGQFGTANMIKVLGAHVDAHASGHHQYFAPMLGLADAWRAFPDFRDSCVYLDIETDGGSSGNSITTIGLYDGNEFTALIKGIDLENFRDLITRYSMIVTFFGAGFDIPILKKRFPDVVFDHLHIDLCPTLRRLGLRGGLKSIEKQMGLVRGENTDGLNGRDAIRLWHRYTHFNDDDALRTLIAYNREDVVNLEKLAEHAYFGLRRASFDRFVSELEV